MAIDAFIQFNASKTMGKVLGESQDTQLKGSDGWSSIKSVEFSATHAATIETGKSGAAHAKLAFEEFSITKLVDIASPNLFLALCAGDTFNNAIIVCRKAVGGPKASNQQSGFLSYTFETVFVTNISTSISDGDDAPTETVKFAYAGMQIRYIMQKPDGTMDSPKYAEWSLTTNQNKLENLIASKSSLSGGTQVK